MLSIGTVDVHCEERFSQILRIAAWVRWYCWSKLAQLLQRGRYFSNKSEPPEHFESSRCCFNHGCLFQEDGFNFRFNPFQRQALNAPSLICESVICPAMTCRAAFFSLFLAERHWNALDWKSLRQKHQIHPFLVSKLKPKKNHGFMKFTSIHKILYDFIIFRIFPHDPFFEIRWLSPRLSPSDHTPSSQRIAHWGSHCDRKPRRLSTRPLPMDTSVALGAWSLTLTPFKTPMDQEIHGKSWDMNHFWKGILWYDWYDMILWYDSYDGDIYFLIASKIVKDYGFQWRLRDMGWSYHLWQRDIHEK